MLEANLGEIKDFLNAATIDVHSTDFGYVIIKGNWAPSRSTEDLDKINILGLDLNLKGRVLHERVLFISRDKTIPIRSHEEVDQEIVQNIGHYNILMTLPGSNERIILPGQRRHSVDGKNGFFHGFHAKNEGILYVAKAVHKDFVEGNSFRVPENTYKGD
jgi:hypothetical protein